MQLTQLQRSVDLVTPKGVNHKGEQCFYAYLWGKILDVIENLKTWVLEVVRLQGNNLVRQNFTLDMFYNGK